MGAVFLLVGIITSAIFLLKIMKAFASANWPRVKGELLSTALRTVVFKGREADGTPDYASAAVADFKYEYEVDGVKYSGSKVTFSDNVSKPLSSLRKLQKLYKGQNNIWVYYNPQKPGESVLIPGVNIFNFTPLITSFLFLAAGIYLMNMEL